MQLKMENRKKSILEMLQKESDYITYLLEAFEIPETVDNADDDDYLLEVPKKKQKLMVMGDKKPAETPEELQERAEVIRQKLESRKLQKKTNKPTITKAERKKEKMEKMRKKKLSKSKRDAVKNEILKQNRGANANGVKKEEIEEDPDVEEKKKPVYNKEGKLFFSKVTIDGEKTKTKKKGNDPNPKKQLQKLKSEKKKITELVETGDKEKASELKQKMLWEAAFDKTEGVKVKDNVEILHKNIKKREKQKKKTKLDWKKRVKSVEEKQAARQKKREDNLNKRKDDKKKTKLKRAVKKGRIIPGISG